MGSGFNRAKAGDPVLVDFQFTLIAAMVDATRIFDLGQLSDVWQQRLDDMIAVKEEVVDVLDQIALQPGMASRTCARRGTGV